MYQTKKDIKQKHIEREFYWWEVLNWTLRTGRTSLKHKFSSIIENDFDGYGKR